MHISSYVTAGEADSAGHSYHMPHVPIVLSHSVSFTNSESMLERCQPRERERMAAETRDERAATLRHLSINTSLTLAQQCFTFTEYLRISNRLVYSVPRYYDTNGLRPLDHGTAALQCCKYHLTAMVKQSCKSLPSVNSTDGH